MGGGGEVFSFTKYHKWFTNTKYLTSLSSSELVYG